MSLKSDLRKLGIRIYRNNKTQASYVKKSEIKKVLGEIDEDEIEQQAEVRLYNGDAKVSKKAKSIYKDITEDAQSNDPIAVAISGGDVIGGSWIYSLSLPHLKKNSELIGLDIILADTNTQETMIATQLVKTTVDHIRSEYSLSLPIYVEEPRLLVIENALRSLGFSKRGDGFQKG